MKLKENKHDHKLTKILKVFLFTLVMLFPLGNIIVRSLYVICNKNAYMNYSEKLPITNDNGPQNPYNFTANNYWVGINTNNTLDNNSGLSMVNKKQFRYNYNDKIFAVWKLSSYTAPTNTSTRFYGESTAYQSSGTNIKKQIDQITYLYTTVTLNFDNKPNYMYLYGQGDQMNLTIQAFGMFKINNYFNENTNSNEIFNQLYNQLDNFFETGKAFVETNKTANLDKVFENSFTDLENSAVVSWTKNTAIYTGIQTMTNQLGITGNTIPCLLTYWFFMIVIYVIIDIILETYTAVTHLFIKKTE